MFLKKICLIIISLLIINKTMEMGYFPANITVTVSVKRILRKLLINNTAKV